MISQVLLVIVQCVLSGAIFTSLCAAIVIPSLAWLGVRSLGPTIVAMHDDRRRQAADAATAAAIPGTLFLVLASFGLAVGSKSPCLGMPAGRALYGLLIVLVIFAFVRAAIRALVRKRQLAALVRGALPARGAAETFARAIGVTLYELPDHSSCSIFAAKTSHVAVYISTLALQRFNEDELRAALYHERAHIERRDHVTASWLYFLTDLVPYPVGDLVDLYRFSREFCADENAVFHVERTALASALLCVARGQAPHATTGAMAFAERNAIHGRLDALLRSEQPVSRNGLRHSYVRATLVLLFALGVAAPTLGEFFFACTMSRLLG